MHSSVEIRNVRVLSTDEMAHLKDFILTEEAEADVDWPLIMMPSDKFSTFLVFISNQLVAYCRYFLFFDDMAEVYVLIKEDSQKVIIFEKLMRELTLKLKCHNINKISIKSEDTLQGQSLLVNANFLKGQSFVRSQTECHMSHPVIEDGQMSGILQADSHDRGAILALDRAVFIDDNHIDKTALDAYIKAKDAVILLIKEKDRLLAKVHLKQEAQAVVLSNLAVSPAARRQGCAKRLLQASLAWSYNLGSKTLSLVVDKENEPAVNLYLKEGFTIMKLSEFYQRALSVNYD